MVSIKDNDEYKFLMENTVDCIWVFDLGNQCFKYISPAVFNLRGLTVEEAMETLQDSLTPASMEKLKGFALDRFPKFMAGDRSESVVSSIDEYEQYCKDGTIKIVEISTKFILNEQTNSIDVLGVSRDIMGRKNFVSGTIIEAKSEECRVYFFGTFLVYEKGSDSPIIWRTSKSKELFAFLLHNKSNKISKWEICNALWPECDFEKLDVYLHTTIYKMKIALQKAGIEIDMKFQNGYYLVSMPKIHSDIAEFEELIENNKLSHIQFDEKAISQYERVLALYKNDYMDRNDYFWAIPKREQYSEQFQSIANALASYYMSQKDYDAAKRVILKILENNNLDEDAHEVLLKLYILKNDRLSFLNHYERMKELLFAELGISPRESVREMYKDFFAATL